MQGNNRPPELVSPDFPYPARCLTDGEIAWCHTLFGDAIDYARVRVHARGWLPFALQWRHTAMSPDGHIWYHPQDYRADFAREPAWRLLWFMHEMVHVWQWQLGYPVMARGAVRIGLSYRYELAPGKRLADFNMEAQGDLLADWFALQTLGLPGAMRQPHYATAAPLFEEVLAGFLADPCSCAHLPRCPAPLLNWLRRRRSA
ncbi:hypothetical protein IP92_00524 [Pseudoduganella flava]|uniref:Rhs element Vgr protein n=1 Tax=Pseudoduganella flava TaxID=871742 RepID=A0A562Q452_9BURK|nr:hypothetical protein IP92_00524 [Pseudoduganella flava]